MLGLKGTGHVLLHGGEVGARCGRANPAEQFQHSDSFFRLACGNMLNKGRDSLTGIAHTRFSDTVCYASFGSLTAGDYKLLIGGRSARLTDPMTEIDRVRNVLRDALQLGPRAAALDERSPLLGAIPELDSMAVVTVIGLLEEDFGITFADDEVSAEVFETLGSLAAFVRHKVSR